MVSKSKVKPAATKQIIHELNSSGNHRIVILNTDGTNQASEWISQRDIAHLEGLSACAAVEYGLPIGVFRTTAVAAQVIA